MRQANSLPGATMCAQGEFMDAITSLILENKLRNIIETGSYLGAGTTEAIAKGLTGCEQVYSIEVNPKFHKAASKRHEASEIIFLNGLSVGKPHLPIDITYDVPANIICDHPQETAAGLYHQEINYPVADNMLEYALSKMNYMPDLVILDSAGNMGMIEFNYLMERVKGSFFLALDDTLHVKHYHTLEIIKSDRRKYDILFETDQKFGSAIIRVSL